MLYVLITLVCIMLAFLLMSYVKPVRQPERCRELEWAMDEIVTHFKAQKRNCAHNMSKSD